MKEKKIKCKNKSKIYNQKSNKSIKKINNLYKNNDKI